MGWLNDLAKAAWRPPQPRAGRPAADDNFWYGPVGLGTASGMRVTPETALASAPVFACVKVLAESVAVLPLLLYQRLVDGSKTRAPEHPLFDVLHRRPNQWQTAFEFWSMSVSHVALRGNAYSQIVPGRRGPVDQLIPLHPDRVRVVREESGRLTYEVRPRATGNDRTTAAAPFVLTQDQMFHLRGPFSNGVVGQNPIEIAREPIGLSLAAQEYAARFFQNDATPGGVLEHPGVGKGAISAEAEKTVRDSFVTAQTGVHRHKPAVLAEGMTYHQIGMTNKDAQFIEARKFSAVDIARIFRVPPHLIGILDRATFSNIEQQAIDFVIYTLSAWLVSIEQAISRDLIVRPDVFFAEFLVEGLLRGDAKTRSEFYASGIQNGWMTRNEVRMRENLNPLPGLDEPLQPLNMTSPGAAFMSSAARLAGIAAPKGGFNGSGADETITEETGS